MAIREQHGMSKTPVYKAWEKMKARCLDKSNPRYGGRGIEVCATWNNSFIAFFEDMGPKPSADHSIERIDNNKGYYKENCKWATPEEQANNTCRNNTVTAFGKTQSRSQWAKELGIPINTLSNRLDRGKMPPEKALVSHKISCANHRR